jgi:hypothetical protein
MLLSVMIIVMQSALRAGVLAAFVLLLSPAGATALLLRCLFSLLVMIVMFES